MKNLEEMELDELEELANECDNAACKELAERYRKGIGVPVNLELAEKYTKLSGDDDEKSTKNNIDNSLDKKWDEWKSTKSMINTLSLAKL